MSRRNPGLHIGMGRHIRLDVPELRLAVYPRTTTGWCAQLSWPPDDDRFVFGRRFMPAVSSKPVLGTNNYDLGQFEDGLYEGEYARDIGVVGRVYFEVCHGRIVRFLADEAETKKALVAAHKPSRAHRTPVTA